MGAVDRDHDRHPLALDDLLLLERVDRHDTRGVLADFPAQCRRASRFRLEPPLSSGRPRVVVVAGMGGSAASGDFLAATAAESLDVPIIVHRGFGLPAAAGDQALVIASSYSGETPEVLAAVAAAEARGLPVVSLTAGGDLGRFAAVRGLPRIVLPPGLMPRMALGYLLFPALTVLAAVGLEVTPAGEIEEALDVVEALAKELVPERPTDANEAKRLALALGPRLPAIYGGPLTGAVAYRWKTDLEENAKTFALAGALPEVGHNEIEAWRPPGAARLHAVFLRDAAEPPEIARRFAVLAEIITPSAGGLSEAWTRGGGRLARLLSLAYLGAWTSYYLAVLRGVDPWTVPLLDELKRRMRAES